LSNDPQIAEKIPGKHEKNVKKQDELKARDLPEKQHHILPTSLLKKPASVVYRPNLHCAWTAIAVPDEELFGICFGRLCMVANHPSRQYR